MALITVEDVEAYTGETYDSAETAVMEDIIDAVSEYFSYYCDTKFDDDVYSERVSFIDNGFSLKNRLQYFYGVFVGITDAIEVTPPSVNSSIKIDETGDSLTLISGFTSTEIDISDKTLSEAVGLITAESGWTASLKDNVTDYYAKTLYAGTWKADKDDSNKITIQSANDMYDASQVARNVFQTGASCTEGQVIYQGGYATIPADLKDACIRFVIKSYQDKSSTTASGDIKSEKVGDYSYTLFTASEESGGLGGVSIEYYDVLNRYKLYDI